MSTVLQQDLKESNERCGFHLIRGFMTTQEVIELRRLALRRSDLFVQTSGMGTFGPRYGVVDGDKIRNQMPEFLEYGKERVKSFVEEFASEPLKLMWNSKKAIRLQLYRIMQHGFRWHFDGHPYVALLMLKNTLRGQTHIMSTKMSSVLRRLPSTLYTIPHVLDIIPYQSITMEEGDMLIMRGSDLLHRGVSLNESGERLLLVYAYDKMNRHPKPVMDRIARRTDNWMFR